MYKKKVQLQDIASATGTNVSTVSIVLNGHARERRISQQLEQKILVVAKKMNYKPNALAQSLRLGRSHILGLIFPDMSNQTFATLGRFIEELASKEKYRIMACSSGEDDDDPEKLISSLIDYQVDGMIIAPTTKMKPSLFKMFEESGMPYVIVDRVIPGLNAYQVTADNFNIGFIPTEHLIKQGLDRIAIFLLPTSLKHMEDRLSGYQQAMRQYNKPICPGYVKLVPYENIVEETKKAIDEALLSDPQIEAIIFMSNMIGLPALEYLYHSKGVKIPKELKIVSMEGVPYFALMNPSITSMNLNIKLIADKAVELLLQSIRDKQSVQPVQYTIPVYITIRKSSLNTRNKK